MTEQKKIPVEIPKVKIETLNWFRKGKRELYQATYKLEKVGDTDAKVPSL
jgi:hypothetical protein